MHPESHVNLMGRGNPPSETGIACQLVDIVRYDPNKIPRCGPTIVENRAIDISAHSVEQGGLIQFDVPRVNNSPEAPDMIERLNRARIPKMETTFAESHALDYRMPNPFGHSNSVTFANAGISPSVRLNSHGDSQSDCSEFQWDGTVLYYVADGKKIRLANFRCEIIRKYVVADMHAETEYLCVRYTKASENSVELDLPLAKFIENNYAELYHKHPEFCLYPDSGRQVQLYRLYCSEQYDNSNAIVQEHFYGCPGWHKTAGVAHYYSEADSHCQTKRALAPLNGINISALAAHIAKMLEIAPLQVMLPVMLVMHSGPAKALFEEAGYREDFATILIAPSGSGKSYLARAFFTYQDGEFINFEATDCAIDLEMESRIDAACVIDDMKAGRSKPLTAKVEHILRQIGDTTGKKKSINGGTEQEQVVTRCSIVITAENDLDELQPSGRFRTLAISIKPDELTKSSLLRKFHDNIVLAHGQGCPGLLDYYMSAYIRFLEEHYVEIVDVISSSDFSPPSELQARQATIFRALAKQAEIVLRFWVWCRLVTEEEAADILRNQWMPVLDAVLLYNDRRGKRLDPVMLFLRAIAEGIASQRLPIAEGKTALESSSNRFTGFWDNGILKLFPDATFEYVARYYEGLGIQFVETQNGILNKLYAKEGLLEVYEQKGHKAKLLKSVKIRGVKTPILCLIWPRVEQILAEAGWNSESTF